MSTRTTGASSWIPTSINNVFSNVAGLTQGKPRVVLIGEFICLLRAGLAQEFQGTRSPG